MLQFTALLLVFVYFKIARVHKKEETMTTAFIVQHIIVLLASLFLFYHAFMTYSWYTVVLLSLLFFIMASLMVTVIQLGIFVEGKPLFGLSRLYKYLPLLTGTIVLFTASLI